MDLATIGLAVLALGAVVALALAVVVLRTNARATANRRLAAVLALEALFVSILTWGASRYGGESGLPHVPSVMAQATLVAISCAYLALLSILDTPLVRPLRSKATTPILACVVLAVLVTGLVWGTPAENVDHPMVALNGVLATTMVVGVGAFGIASTYSAYRRTRPRTAARKRAGTLLAAFATRDSLWVLSIAGGLLFSNLGRDDVGNFFWSDAPGLIVLTYVPLLAYAILKTQVFDIDLKIKLGIQRSTVVTIVAVVSVIVGKLVDRYAQAQWGWVAGIGVAVGMLFFTRGLSRVGDKVARAAMPNVENTSRYVEFRKMEVYKTAVESALEGGEPTPKERHTLERLRANLGIPHEDATAIERDLRERLPAAGAP